MNSLKNFDKNYLRLTFTLFNGDIRHYSHLYFFRSEASGSQRPKSPGFPILKKDGLA